ncbi:hypothetical protein P7228_07980 [Altererythrobacter arenosus]|uniref:Porin n=1 Tax=Altererythrobacter arenosus TaxID=3032592 RepID=A0ABY8FVA1_9SPHN|nr:hypothetical protein [Altererythrobacter sp. CAU 1644]WFL75949.1 hypothetical protein P7228_07980 [Altererythrobacter sp. CAU 1644]
MKYALLAAVAGSALAVSGTAMAQDSEPGSYDGESGVEVDLRYANNIDTSVTTDVTYTKDVALRGAVRLRGTIDVDSSAVAVTDAKQFLTGVEVTYREENELNGENGYVAEVFGIGWSEPGFNGPSPDPFANGVPEDQIRAGFFAPIINTVDAFNVDSSGNVGVNLAAGYFNQQMNSASIAVSEDNNEEAAGGWAEASTTGLQSLIGVAQYAARGFLDEDDPEEGGGQNNFRDRNTILGATITGSGNIGVNVAAGSLNQQSNLMTLAVANNADLAEANAGLIQTALLSGVEQQDSINSISGLDISGASGNIGVNMAAGVGNQQTNSLTIAASQGDGSGNPQTGGGINDPS